MPGEHRYDVALHPLDEASDTGAENNEGGAFVRVIGGSRALVAADVPESAAALRSAIANAGFDTELVGPTRIPTDIASLAAFDLVVLCDVSASALTDEQMRAMASYVRELGGGLLMCGARRSFGLGGYAHTSLEEALPATFDLRQRRDRLSLAMVISIDKSGSMTMPATPTATKLDLANEAASRSALLLSPTDRVGINHVDTGTTWTQPMVSVEDPSQIAATVRRAQPGGGGIDVSVALIDSYRALRLEETQLKHLLLFSDGSDSQNLGGARELVRQAARDRITTSVVSMGDGPDTPELEQLSRIGGGRFYIVEDLRQLPQIFTQETVEASRAALEEVAFRPTSTGVGAAVAGIDFGAAPPLLGYAVVQARGRATTHLRATDEDPLLVSWQHGLGRSAAFATDVGVELAQPWLSWSGYAALFSQLARQLARTPERGDMRVHFEIDDGRGLVRVEAVDDDGRYRDYLDLEASVSLPGGEGQVVELRQTGAGRYEASFDAARPGPYLVMVHDDELIGSAAAVRSVGTELSGEGTRRDLLGQLAALTGGTVRTDLDAVFTDRPEPTYAYKPAWPTLVVLGLLGLLSSVATRRLVIRSLTRRRVVSAKSRSQPGLAEAAVSDDMSPRVRSQSAPSSTKSGQNEPDLETANDDQPAEATPAPLPAPPGSLAERLLEERRKKR